MQIIAIKKNHLFQVITCRNAASPVYYTIVKDSALVETTANLI
jgi:hypothetical protein